MMTQQLGFSVLSAPIAAIDRRALSQAWFSALRLARDRAPDAQAPALRVASSSHADDFPAPARSQQRGVCRVGAPKPSPVEIARSHRSATPPVDRRANRTALARKIEYAFLHPRKAVHRATFSLEGSGARVHVSVQRSGGGFVLVAVCAPKIRDVVTRAIAEARYALAARGIAIDARIAE